MNDLEKEKQYCNGLYYNFKKGMEHCVNCAKCELFQNYEAHHLETGHYYGVKQINIFPIAKFRNCKIYEN